jgi:lipoic acid synthetase
MGECWARGVATIMILGDTCTRSCGFCNVKTGKPPTLDLDEPARVAESLALMQREGGLRHIVITSVNRDELPDGGAAVWAETVARTREACPGMSIEVLIPDFEGNWDALRLVIDARPEILNHNVETVRRMYPAVRPQAKLERSIELLRRCKDAGLVTKTGVMVGIGERDDEVLELMDELRAGAGTDILTIGQYLQPTPNHLPIDRFVTPETFVRFRDQGLARGFKVVESGAMVRSSYHADKQADELTGIDREQFERVQSLLQASQPKQTAP